MHVNAIIFSVLCVMPNIINATVIYRPTVVLIERPFDIMASRQWKLLWEKWARGQVQCHATKLPKRLVFPRSTLSDKLDGKSPEDRRMCPNPVLNKVEEDALAKHCNKILKCGFPVNHDDLCDVVVSFITWDSWFLISRNSNTSRGHLCILSWKYFRIASVDSGRSKWKVFYGICTERKSAKNCQRKSN